MSTQSILLQSLAAIRTIRTRLQLEIDDDESPMGEYVEDTVISSFIDLENEITRALGEPS